MGNNERMSSLISPIQRVLKVLLGAKNKKVTKCVQIGKEIKWSLKKMSTVRSFLLIPKKPTTTTKFLITAKSQDTKLIYKNQLLCCTPAMNQLKFNIKNAVSSTIPP